MRTATARVGQTNNANRLALAHTHLSARDGGGTDHCRPVNQAICVGPEPSSAADHRSEPSSSTRRSDPSEPAKVPPPPIRATPAQTQLDLTSAIVDLWRQRQDIRRAEARLDLQCQAVCRRACGGDKAMAGKLWGRVLKGAATDEYPGLASALAPYLASTAPLTEMARLLERQIEKAAVSLPLWQGWAAGVRGVGALSFGGLIGEAAAMPGEYRTVAGLWKRFGLAVIDGGRQRRVRDAGQALEHGYSPARRAFAYVLSTSLMRSQRADDTYREAYDRRKAYELARGIPKAHAHNRSLRYMVKALLKDAWRADRLARGDSL